MAPDADGGRAALTGLLVQHGPVRGVIHVRDLATANRGSNTVSVLPGRPDAPGQFAATVTLAAGAGSRAVVP